ncbi:hypothetical protein LTR10_011808 [Elasticomyces elasticus]|uniref:Uncharacterized protein n=1 Tax=Exophiala sideris TaxID=1016849 RepID=A0ABR0JDS8_9EURO|nr:hypothetical protein LTR10_011808 [Elasticomyces elasticus]KAK5031734.1 hypothetical protein LTS07_004354 [Exophiala sideris]KAK5040663.1 hypothetical protein LTR13_002963 [Exophiala sideris]KAK5062003.1 hypothetical protein LTR69_005187 [Exophiala sideris]KAK5184703.1 hypothetical protein LTR44_003378 [Eurotiomycetes sp. CCFEE 6388]
MDGTGAGRRPLSRSLYDRLFNIPPTPNTSDSQHSLSPIIPPYGRSYTVDSLTSPQERLVEFTKSELNDLPPTNPAPIPSAIQESPKQAIKKGFWANSSKLLPHLAAAIITLVVVQINLRNLYWMDLVAPNVHILPGISQGGALNALQLAAKLHELILVASLGTIVMHVAQAHMVGKHGLPLGLLTNSFAVGSGDFLNTKAFWASAWTSKAHYLRFWLLSLLATLLATLAGPSSAIAVIPSLNWFPLDKPFDSDVLPYYIFNQSTVLWPDNVTGASENSGKSGINCTAATVATQVEEICPAGGFSNVYTWAGNLLFANSTAGSNISFPDARGDTRRVLSTQSCNSLYDGRASGISLNTFITGALTAYWTFAQNNFEGLGLFAAQPKLTLNTPVYAPKIEVLCNGSDYMNETAVQNRSSVSFPSFTNKTLPSEGFVLPYAGLFNDTDFQWVEMLAGPDNPTLGAVVRVPWIYLHDTNTSSYVSEQATEIHACSIYAQWIPVDVFYEPRTNDQVSFNIKGLLTDTCLTAVPREASTHQPLRNMTIDLDYASAMNQLMPFETDNIPAIPAMLDQTTFEQDNVGPNNGIGYDFKAPFLGSVNGEDNANTTFDEIRKTRATMISTLLAGVVTDGLARIGGNGIFPYSAAMFLTNKTNSSGGLVGRFVVTSAEGGEDDSLNATSADVDNWLRIDPVISRYGYGYRWEGSNTAKFGIVVLLIHLALAVVHTMFILYKVLIMREGLVSSWTTIAELLTLAMNSSPSSRLQNTCAGVERAKTWRQVVAVRETYPGHLEMVVGPNDKNRHPLPQSDRDYGHLMD